MIKATLFTTIFMGAVWASSANFLDFAPLLAKSLALDQNAVPASLAKVGTVGKGTMGASTSLALTSYASANYNVRFQCPSGWTITSIDSVANRVLLNVAKIGRNSVLVYVTKHATASEANYWDAYSTWLGVRTAFGSSQTTPYVVAAVDTTTSPYHLSYVQLEYEPSTVVRIYDLVSASKSLFGQFVAYSATLADYDANSADYDAIWDGMSFYDDAVALNSPTGGNLVLNPHGLTLEFRDAAGRVQLESAQKRIELDKAQKLFLKSP